MSKFQTFLKLLITFEIINVFRCSSTHFESTSTQNVKKRGCKKNYTNFSLDSETV